MITIKFHLDIAVRTTLRITPPTHYITSSSLTISHLHMFGRSTEHTNYQHSPDSHHQFGNNSTCRWSIRPIIVRPSSVWSLEGAWASGSIGRLEGSICWRLWPDKASLSEFEIVWLTVVKSRLVVAVERCLCTGCANHKSTRWSCRIIVESILG